MEHRKSNQNTTSIISALTHFLLIIKSPPSNDALCALLNFSVNLCYFRRGRGGLATCQKPRGHASKVAREKCDDIFKGLWRKCVKVRLVYIITHIVNRRLYFTANRHFAARLSVWNRHIQFAGFIDLVWSTKRGHLKRRVIIFHWIT